LDEDGCKLLSRSCDKPFPKFTILNLPVTMQALKISHSHERNPHMSDRTLIPVEEIEKYIHLIRGYRVMLDRDLARLYDVNTAALNQAVRRNRHRFPDDFMFQLTTDELAELDRSQIVIGSEKHRDPRFRPYVFTEQGIAMLSSVLRSKAAISVNVEIVRAFVRLRLMTSANAELSDELEELESKYDSRLKAVFETIKKLMAPPVRKRKKIGFLSRSVKT
jgi:hypothetical protein